jgi:hypothetical protein
VSHPTSGRKVPVQLRQPARRRSLTDGQTDSLPFGESRGSSPRGLNGNITKITAYAAAHRHGIIATGIFGVVAMAFVLVFMATVVHVTTEPGRGTDSLPRIVGYTGTATAVCFALVQAPASAVATFAAQPGGLRDASLVRLMLDRSSLTEGVFRFMAMFLLVSLSFVVVRRRLLGAWFGWLAAILAVVIAVGGVLGMAVANGGALAAISGIGGFGLAIVIVIVSVIVLRGQVLTPPKGSPVPA